MVFVHKNIRLPKQNYLGERSHFLTICCHSRQPLLAEAPIIARLLEILAAEASRSSFVVHAYCFMPDHLHLLVQGTSAQSDLMRFVNVFKQKSAFEYSKKTGVALWQFKYYDHILRRRDLAARVMAYIWMNPVRKGLVRAVVDYPFSGSFTAPWKEQERISVEDWVPPWKRDNGEEKKQKRPG